MKIICYYSIYEQNNGNVLPFYLTVVRPLSDYHNVSLYVLHQHIQLLTLVNFINYKVTADNDFENDSKAAVRLTPQAFSHFTFHHTVTNVSRYRLGKRKLMTRMMNNDFGV